MSSGANLEFQGLTLDIRSVAISWLTTMSSKHTKVGVFRREINCFNISLSIIEILVDSTTLKYLTIPLYLPNDEHKLYNEGNYIYLFIYFREQPHIHGP